MPLETAVTIDQLVPTNPSHVDATGLADSHLRMIKAALQGTFPALVGSTSVTVASLNALAATITRATNAIQNSGAQTITTGSLTVGGAINASGAKILESSNALIPAGTIVMFNTNTVPAGWAYCDGTNGTPDLRDCFIIARGPAGASGIWGGQGLQATALSGSGVSPVRVVLYIMKL